MQGMLTVMEKGSLRSCNGKHSCSSSAEVGKQIFFLKTANRKYANSWDHSTIANPQKNFFPHMPIRNSQLRKVSHLRKVRKSNNLFKLANLRICDLWNLFANHLCSSGTFTSKTLRKLWFEIPESARKLQTVPVLEEQNIVTWCRGWRYPDRSRPGRPGGERWRGWGTPAGSRAGSAGASATSLNKDRTVRWNPFWFLLV